MDPLKTAQVKSVQYLLGQVPAGSFSSMGVVLGSSAATSTDSSDYWPNQTWTAGKGFLYLPSVIKGWSSLKQYKIRFSFSCGGTAVVSTTTISKSDYRRLLIATAEGKYASGHFNASAAANRPVLSNLLSDSTHQELCAFGFVEGLKDDAGNGVMSWGLRPTNKTSNSDSSPLYWASPSFEGWTPAIKAGFTDLFIFNQTADVAVSLEFYEV